MTDTKLLFLSGKILISMKASFFLMIFIILLIPFSSFSQKKTINAVKLTDNSMVRGKISPEIMESASAATDFIMISPDNGKPITVEKKTEVKVFYDNDAVYISAKMYDDEPSKILKEITARDNFGTADNFAVFINGNNDGQQDFRFYVSAAGVQADCNFTNQNGDDFSWDAIWSSETAITDFGWTADIRIPYAALRFSSAAKQKWGINFYRDIKRTREEYSWNFIDSKINNVCAQSGECEGIENIETPTRLFLIPYASFYLNPNSHQKTKGELKGGLDIKYGINDAFTLDMILVPDFGQAKFDNVELNLGPFEQQFSENRPFFTEGTDLFSKGNLLYSRRIGQAPSIELAENETIDEFPSTIKLINALKVSGRTKNGLGVGVLNAVTENTIVTIRNTETGESRREILEPLANYNVIVLDQRFRKNSSVSFVNTNVTRDGHFRDANVSAAIFDLNTKKNTYNLSGNYKYSTINETGDVKNKYGYTSYLNIGETSGQYRYNIGGEYVSRDFDNNDLGINNITHYHGIYGNASYRILNPTKRFNYFQVGLNLYSEFDNRTDRLQEGSINLNVNSTNKKNNYLGYGLNMRPVKTYDFYEPRSADQSTFIIIPETLGFNVNYSSNYNKKFAQDFGCNYTFVNEKGRSNFGFYVSPRYRFSDKFLLIYNFNYYRFNNTVGWVDFDDDGNTILARRNRITYTNSLQGKYSLNNKMNINLELRHYWSYATTNKFVTLNDDGTVSDNFTYDQNKDSNFNSWNLDLSYSWWFAPGSQMSILYRNNSALFTRDFSKAFDSNFTKAIDNENLNHIISVSVRYFIDYPTIKQVGKAMAKPFNFVQNKNHE